MISWRLASVLLENNPPVETLFENNLVGERLYGEEAYSVGRSADLEK